MQIEIIKKNKLVCIWLTANESDDPKVNAMINPIIQLYHSKQYISVVFRSGKQELCTLTSELLKYNRKLFAEQELEAEQSHHLSDQK